MAAVTSKSVGTSITARVKPNMFWYSAHLVLRVMFKDGENNNFPVMENIVLIFADDENAAYVKAEALGFSLEGDSDGSFTWNDRAATWKFVGVRKLLEIRNSHSRNDSIDENSEASYSTFEFDNAATLRQFMLGEVVSLKVLE